MTLTCNIYQKDTVIRHKNCTAVCLVRACLFNVKRHGKNLRRLTVSISHIQYPFNVTSGGKNGGGSFAFLPLRRFPLFPLRDFFFFGAFSAAFCGLFVFGAELMLQRAVTCTSIELAFNKSYVFKVWYVCVKSNVYVFKECTSAL